MLFMPIVITSIPEGDDRDYMQQLYEKYGRLMFATAWKFSNSQAEVEDIVSDCCLKLFKHLDTLQTLNESKLKGYIYSAIKNTALNRNYSLQHSANNSLHVDERFLENVPAAIDVERQIELEDELDLVWRAIRQLPEKEQQIMYMKYKLDLPDDVIAERTGLARGSIRKYVSRARSRLKKAVYTEQEADV